MDAISCAECGTLFAPPTKKSTCCTPKCRMSLYKKTHREDAKRRSVEWRLNNPDKYEVLKLNNRLNGRKSPRFGSCKECGREIRLLGKRLFCCRSCQARHRRKTKPEWYREKYQRDKQRSNLASRQRYHRTRATSPWEPLITMAKVRAKQKKIPFNLTNEWGKRRWTEKCEVTGLRFTLGLSKRGPFSPSIDQIVPGSGYTTDNCRFVLWAINAFKATGTDEEMFLIAEAISRASVHVRNSANSSILRIAK